MLPRLRKWVWLNKDLFIKTKYAVYHMRVSQASWVVYKVDTQTLHVNRMSHLHKILKCQVGGSISQINSSRRNLNAQACIIYSPNTTKDELATWKDLRTADCQNRSCTHNLEKCYVKQVDVNLGIKTSSKETQGSIGSMSSLDTMDC